MFRVVYLTIMIVFLMNVVSCSSNSSQSTKIHRKYYNLWEKEIGFAQVTQIGNTLYLSGVTSKGATFEEQLKSIYSEIETMLADFGATTAHISKEVIYTTDMDLLAKAIPIRKQYFSKDLYPSATWVQVERLFLPELMLEVEVVVELP